MTRIAIVEDNARLAGLIQRGIAVAGVASDVFGDIASAWPHLLGDTYVGAIIDRGLPGGDGLDLVRRLREKGQHLPCLMLTARDALHDRVAGLDAGADDYLVKPFAMEELVARVRALMRRPQEVQMLELQRDGLRISPDLHSMACGEDSVTLAPAELQIMLCLMRADGRNVSRARLESAAWGVGTAVTPNALDVALHRLRRKLAAIGSPLELVNLRNHGFVLRGHDAL